jgi:hypothetical protein
VGNLPFVVVGIKEGKLQTIDFKEGYKEYSKPLTFTMKSISDAFNPSEGNPSKKPSNSFKIFRGAYEWKAFRPWQFIHSFFGEADTPRTHAFFVPIREVVGGAQFKIKGNKISLQ